MFLLNYETLIDPLFKDVRRFAPDFSGMAAGDNVIDVCCGTGAQVLEYGRRGIKATGIDINPDMIQTAERNRRRDQVSNISFQSADATELPFPDACFDFASITLGLHDKERSVRNNIVSEMKRVIKREGALLLIDYRVPLPRRMGGMTARIVEFLAGGTHYRSFRDYLARNGIEDILRNHDLRAVRRTDLKGGLLSFVKAMT